MAKLAELGKKPLGLGALAMAAFMLALAGLTVWSVHRESRLETQFAKSAAKTRLAGQLRVSLFTAAEAEKSAVLAETDEASHEFAGRARQASEAVAAALAELKALPPGPAAEAEALRRFEDAFGEYRKVDEDVLALAVQNTNLKAQALSFGEAAGSLARLEAALEPWLAGRGKPEAQRQALIVLAEAQRIQALHAPHIAEREDARMDGIEARMDQADARVRAGLAALAAQAGTGALASARTAYEDFHRVTGEIIALSRQNTNVRSLDMSLDRKVKALAVCDEAAKALEEQVSAGAAKASR